MSPRSGRMRQFLAFHEHTNHYFPTTSGDRITSVRSLRVPAHAVIWLPLQPFEQGQLTGRQAPARRQEAGRGIQKNACPSGPRFTGDRGGGQGSPAIAQGALVDSAGRSVGPHVSPHFRPQSGGEGGHGSMPSADFYKVLQNYHSLGVNLVLSTSRTGTISLVATVGSPT